MKIIEIARALRNQKVLNYKDYKITTDDDIMQEMSLFFKEKLIAKYTYNPFTKDDLVVYSPGNSKELNLINNVLDVFGLGKIKKGLNHLDLIYETYKGTIKEGVIETKKWDDVNYFII